MSFSATFVTVARNILPSPFSIAVLLTFVTILLALVLTGPVENPQVPYLIQIVGFWERGFWGLLEFAMQMMLMLVLGHVLALTPQANALMRTLVRYCTDTPRSAAIVTLLTMLVGLFNWGLGLIFGAIFARKVADSAQEKGYEINYPIIGGAGYVGMMVWHGGLSGSAPLKVAETNHFLVDKIGVIPISETIFSPMNLAINIALLIILPLGIYLLGKTMAPTPLALYIGQHEELPLEAHEPETAPPLTPAEKLDQSTTFAWLFALMFLIIGAYRAFIEPETVSLAFLNLNFINFLLFALGIILYGNLKKYMVAVDEAITGASGIMLQFPLYAGIAGIMQYSGLIQVYSDWMVAISNQVTFPLWTFISASFVNVFVPSGGGQWAVQGPIVADAASKLGVSHAKCVMALAYGDQLTNMIQPFWALPLLAITRLSAQEIIPYSFFLMVLGAVVMCAGLLIF